MSKPSVPGLLLFGLLFGLPLLLIALLWRGSDGEPHPVSEAAVGGATPTEAPAQGRSPRTPIPTRTYREPTPKDSASPPVDPEREEPHALESVLEGRVLGPGGGPVALAGVSFFPLGPEGPKRRAIVTVESNAEGRYRMTLPPTCPREGLLMAHREHLRPEALAVTVRRHGAVRGLEFRLEEGLVIRGTVTWNGLPMPRSRWPSFLAAVAANEIHPHGEGICVGLDALFGTPGVSILTSGATSIDLPTLLWTRGRPEVKATSVETGPDGTFEIGGLSPGVIHRLNLWDWQAGNFCHPDVFRAVEQDVVPGATVHIDIRTALVTVSVRGEGESRNRAMVKLTSGTTGAAHIAWADQAAWGSRVAPGASHVLRVTARGHLPFQVDIPPLQVGEARHIDVPLIPHDDPDVVITLRGAEALNLGGISVRFVSPTPSQDERGGVVVLRASRTRGDEFHLEDVPLPVGRYTIVVSGQCPSSQMLLPVETTVDLQDGVVDVTLEARLGGRCEVTVAHSVEEFTYQLWALLGETALSVTIVRSELTFPGEEFFLMNGATSHADAARLLEPGDYELEVTCDNKQVIRERVVIRAGETTVRRVE
jgi:hypothetical protein